MHYLRRYIGGGVRQVFDSCFLLNTESAYADAWSAWDRRYGDPFSVGQAYRDKLFSWPKIGSTDSEGIRRLADFLLSCKAAMSVVPGLQSLDSCHENQRIISRLPDWMVYRWNRLVFTAVEESTVYPPFSRFVNFDCKGSAGCLQSHFFVVCVKRTEPLLFRECATRSKL